MIVSVEKRVRRSGVVVVGGEYCGWWLVLVYGAVVGGGLLGGVSCYIFFVPIVTYDIGDLMNLLY